MTAAPIPNARQLTPTERAVLEQFVPPVAPAQGDATAVVVAPAAEPRKRRRVSLLALVRRPSRTAQLDRLLDRYRWANAGLRERLRVEVTAHDATLGDVEAHADEWARIIGHAHPLVLGLRATVRKARP